jgi:hypothetical protein
VFIRNLYPVVASPLQLPSRRAASLRLPPRHHGYYRNRRAPCLRELTQHGRSVLILRRRYPACAECSFCKSPATNTNCATNSLDCFNPRRATFPFSTRCDMYLKAWDFPSKPSRNPAAPLPKSHDHALCSFLCLSVFVRGCQTQSMDGSPTLIVSADSSVHGIARRPPAF